jgi:tetratricopeptide (TPR) repeat protein/transcriptional regulator with XRE-family HTH domain
MGSNGLNTFGAMLRRRRFAAGLTQEELAERATLSVRTIRDLEHGTSQPHLRTVVLLADALELAEPDRAELTRVARPAPGEPDPGPGRAPEPPQAAPRQLPAAPADFTGRSAELKALAGTLDRGDTMPGTVVITAIGGTAGVGKTALAVHWAHQIADRFPDGQLYVNLRGYDPGQPMPPADALAGFLRALGVPGHEIPPEPEERAAKYRSLLAERRLLVVLDNAGSVEQVRPLLPGTATCTVLVTSRDALAGLVARDGARRVDLDLLSPTDANMLLTTLIGDRAAADPDVTDALAAACARLPLALRVAAELAATRPGTPLAELAAELADQQQRLDLLDAGDPYSAVRTVFSWSYQHLDPGTARAFRMIGLHPGPDLELYAAAALTDTTMEQARSRLDVLERAHLIQPAQPGRYSPHDLLRAYARELVAAEDGDHERRAALTRLFDHYLHTAVAAVDMLSLLEPHERPGLPPPATPTPPLPGQAEARAWLDAQRATLIAVAAYTADHGWPAHATRIAAAVARYLDTTGHYAEGILIHTAATRAARQAGDHAAEANALTNLGLVVVRQGRYEQATAYLVQAVDLSRDSGGVGAERALGNLAIVTFWQGDYEQSKEYGRQVLALCQRTGNQIGQARALTNLALVELRQGAYEQVSRHLGQALTLTREAGNPALEAYILADLGMLHLRQGRPREASTIFKQSLDLHREVGNMSGMAYTTGELANVELRQGRHEQAGDQYRQALAMFRDTGEHAGEAGALNGLGELFLATGQPGQAHTQHTAALELADQIGEKYEQARAHAGLGHALDATGDPGRARHHWQRAVTLYTELGAPEAAQIRDSLARLGVG